MNKMKRIFSLVLAFSIVLGTFGAVVPAFAADETPVVAEKETTEILRDVPKDVIGTEYEDAIRRLVAFGIVGGYPDGTYQPEKEINRAQFAKLVVEALGLRDAVPAAEGKTTGFKDVKADYWAAGYINVASGQGLLKGFPDGTFRPAAKVNYAQALTMLVRTLGYQDEFLPGNWPGNYVAKAADVGITSGVKLPSTVTEGGKRGLVAQLVNNTLDSEIVKVGKYVGISGIEYEETEITLLKDKLNISKHEDTRIFADKLVDDGLRDDEVKVRFIQKTRNDDAVRVSYKENDTKEFRTKKGVNPRPFIGEEVSTYLTDRDEVIYIEREDDDRANFDYVEENKKEDRVSLVKFDKDYKFDKDADVYVFDNSDDEFKYVKGEDVKATDMLGRVGKFVVRNNEVVYAEVYDSTEASPWLLVLENDKDVLKGINKETEDFKVDLTKDRNYDDVLVYDTEGNKLAVKDIKKGNLVYVQKQEINGDDYAVVTVVRDNQVDGKLGKLRDDRVEIGDKTYKAIRYKKDGNKFQAYYSVEKLEDVKPWADVDYEKDMEDAYGEEVTAYLDATGKVAFMTTDVEAKSGYKFGVVTRTYADGDRVRIFTTIDGKEGKDQIFKADKERNLTNPKQLKADGVEVVDKDGTKQNILGQAVKFRLNKDGEIDKDEFYVMPKDQQWTMDADFGKDTMKLKNLKTEDVRSFAVNNNVDIIDAVKLDPKNDKFDTDKGDIESLDTNIDIDDFDIAKWEDMKENNKDTEIKVYVFPKKNRTNEVDGLVFVGDKGANTGSDEIAVYVIKKDKRGDDVEVQFDQFGKGKETKIVDGADYLSDVTKERAYVAKIKSNGKIELKDSDAEVKKYEDYTVYRNVKVLETGSEFKIELKDGKTKTFVYRNDPVTYKEDKMRDARVGDHVDLVVEDDVRVRVVGIVKESTTTSPELGKNQYYFRGQFTVRDNDYITLSKTEDGKVTDYLLGVKLPSEVKKGDKIEVTIKRVDKEDVVTRIELVKEDNKDKEKAEEALKEAVETLKAIEITEENKEEAEKAIVAVKDAVKQAEKYDIDTKDAEAAVEKAEKAIKDLDDGKEPEETEVTFEVVREIPNGGKVFYGLKLKGLPEGKTASDYRLLVDGEEAKFNETTEIFGVQVIAGTDLNDVVKIELKK